MARPRKGEDDKRKLMVYVRMTSEEKQKLFSLAASHGLSPSDYIRVRTLEARPVTRKAGPDRAVFIAALAELGKIGSNVNQIARTLNYRNKSGDLPRVPDELVEYALRGVETMTRHIIQILEGQHGH